MAHEPLADEIADRLARALILPLHYAGRFEREKELLLASKAFHRSDEIEFYQMACMEARSGETQRALAQLKLAMNSGESRDAASSSIRT